MARERRAVTPDGRVWFVRRRWARRRPPWSRRPRYQTARMDADEELPAEEPVVPPIDSFFTYDGRDLDRLGDRIFDRHHDDRHAAWAMVTWLLVGVLVTGLLVAAAVAYVLPWLVPLAVANAWPLLGVAAAVAVLAAVDRLVRPWFVELQRQGLADAPRRVWRVRGWRRSARLMDEVAAAVRDGRIDQRHAAVLFRPGEGGAPR
jgi:hypothetical protein